MENYIVINGKKAELTEEQLKALGIEVPKTNVFERVKQKEKYYFISNVGQILEDREDCFSTPEKRYNIANYCTDKALMEQRALHETLHRLLWRFSMTHNGDKINWDSNRTLKYFIYYDNSNKCFSTNWFAVAKSCDVYFHTKQIAEQAIEEIVKPFIAEHPEFKW